MIATSAHYTSLTCPTTSMSKIFRPLSEPQKQKLALNTVFWAYLPMLVFNSKPLKICKLASKSLLIAKFHSENEQQL